MSDAPAARRPRAPIALQIFLLLVATLAIVQFLTIIVFFEMPPPPPPVYRVREIAHALQLGAPTAGDRLIISRSAQPPEHLDLGSPDMVRIRDRLAHHLDRPATEIVFARRPRPWRFAWGSRPRPISMPPPAAQRDVDLPEPGMHRRGGEIIFGDFVAAMRATDGAWVVVTPKPQPFPNEEQKRFLLWAGLCLLIAAPAGYLFARRITAPIRAFARASEHLGRNPQAPPLSIAGPAEIGVAAAAFNTMHLRLQRRFLHQQALISAISHDLRGPLARLKFRADEAPEAQRAGYIRDIEQMELILSSLVGHLRQSPDDRRNGRVDVRAILQRAAEPAGKQATLIMPEALEIDGDEAALERMFANLIDNAVKYGERAHIYCHTSATEVIVEIMDEGPGLPDAQLEAVFRPFHRYEGTSSAHPQGLGLGLMLARSAARAHGGDVVLIPSPAGLTAQVRLPLAQP